MSAGTTTATSARSVRLSMTALRWAVGVVAGGQALALALHPAVASEHMGLRPVVLLVLAGAEIVAAALFIWRRSLRAGALGLLVVFASALAIHVAVRSWNVGNLVVLASATVAVMAYERAAPKDRSG